MTMMTMRGWRSDWASTLRPSFGLNRPWRACLATLTFRQKGRQCPCPRRRCRPSRDLFPTVAEVVVTVGETAIDPPPVPDTGLAEVEAAVPPQVLATRRRGLRSRKPRLGVDVTPRSR
jgi:hypothetical protein